MSFRHMLTVACYLSHVVSFYRFKVYFSSKLNIVDACVVVVTLVVTMIYTFSDLSGASLIPRYLLSPASPAVTRNGSHTQFSRTGVFTHVA